MMEKKKKRKRRSNKLTRKLAPYHICYRPQTLGDVIGQASVVLSLKTLLAGRTIPHSYLFTGPSGVGKTTLSRILGKTEYLNVDSQNVHEIDAATHSGVDDMREIKKHVETPAFTRNTNRLLIIDECHTLSKSAWQSWLKIVEEPPEHLYIVFCTTEAGKVPKTIKTRCHSFDLKPVGVKEICQLLDEVAFAEQEKWADGVFRAIANKADGSVRQALVYLHMCVGVKDKADVLRILDEADVEGDIPIKICRVLCNYGKFSEVLKLISQLEADNVEGIRILTVNYAAKVLLSKGKKNSDKTKYLVEVIEELSEPFDDRLKKAPLIASAARLLL